MSQQTAEALRTALNTAQHACADAAHVVTLGTDPSDPEASRAFRAAWDALADAGVKLCDHTEGLIGDANVAKNRQGKPAESRENLALSRRNRQATTAEVNHAREIYGLAPVESLELSRASDDGMSENERQARQVYGLTA